jgi:hypothetical protein
MTVDQNIQNHARLAGFLYLLTNLTSIMAFVARAGLMAGNDVARSSAIAASETQFRIGIATELLTVACVLALVVSLYRVLEPFGRGAALLAVSWRLTENLVLTMVTFCEFGMLAVAKDGGGQLASALLPVYGEGFQVGFLFLGLGSTVFSCLWWRSRLIPRSLAGFGIFASSFMAIVSLGIIIWPGLLGVLTMAYMAPMGLFEIGLGLWLLVRGIRLPAQGERS